MDEPKRRGTYRRKSPGPFRPDAKLDPSQVTDLRRKGKTMRGPAPRGPRFPGSGATKRATTPLDRAKRPHV